MRPHGRNGARTAGLGLLACALLCLAQAGEAACAQAASQAPAEAPDPDPDPAAWPLSAVGKLNVITGPGSRQHCTATLIGRRLALTAAHCLYIRARKAWVDPADVHFVAGYAQGRYTVHAIARGYTKPDAYRYGTAPADLARDWALVALAADIPLRPLPISRASGTDVKTTIFSGILHAGYRLGSDQQINVARGCTARRIAGPAPLLGQSCRIAPGESGSALILTGAGGPAIVGVLVATTDNPTAASGRTIDGKAQDSMINDATARAAAPASLAVPASAFIPAAEAALAAETAPAAP